jgi:hypothetical protein
MNESQNYGEEQETFEQAEETATGGKANEIEELKGDISYIKELLMQKTAPATQTVAKDDIEIDASTLERFKADPSELIKYIKNTAEKSKLEIKKEAAKQSWDRQAEEKFPLIKTNKDFQKKVASQIREFTQTGEYSKDDPMLVYRAAQIVSAEFATQNRSNRESQNFTTSAEGRTSVSRESSTQKTKISDNDPRVNFAKLMGVSGEKLERFKSQLGPYVAPIRKQARRLAK